LIPGGQPARQAVDVKDLRGKYQCNIELEHDILEIIAAAELIPKTRILIRTS
jgi:hypothetical protein